MDPLNLIRKRMAGQSLTKTAEELGVSAAYLSMVLNGKRGVGPALLTALGLRREIKNVTQYFRQR